MNKEKFNLGDRLRSFRFAVRGIGIMLVSQHNAWIHAVVTLAIIAIGLYLGLKELEWCLILLAIIAVWTAEALNTALEVLADVASPEFHTLVEKAKDVAAGAVLISAIGAIITGLVIILPYLLS